ncbi:MAG: GAF domain-containing protein [Candidatus Kapaibacteriales bacterium]
MINMLNPEVEKNIYYYLRDFLQQIFGGEKNFIANASNFASLIYYNMEDISWAGFYFASGKDLILGPHQGKTACVQIAIANGVCGAAYRAKKYILVYDVHNFPGYIPCDPTANSELVVPIFFGDKVIGVFDLDSPSLNRFSNQDVIIIDYLLNILVSSSDIEPLLNYYA